MSEQTTNSWKNSIENGEYKRRESQFRHWITADGSSGFKAEPGRYHLYVSLACPWAHRALILRRLKGLEDLIDVSVVHPDLLDPGWSFDPDYPGATGDRLYGLKHLSDLYYRADPDYSGNFTVPTLWDTREQTIVNNESAEIIRMFNSAFDELTGNTLDYYPEPLRDEIDRVNERVYHAINNGVYKTGFATEQSVYETHFDELFAALDEMEERLSGQRYLTGGQITEADWRLFTTLIRFDAVYVGHFKCNRRRIEDYPNLSNYLRDLYQQPGVAETTDLNHIKRHYYFSHRNINANGIVPKGPALGLERPHDRDRFNQ
ncbi:MAG: glutathione S-transferase family protein [Pseudomonadota bacterium]